MPNLLRSHSAKIIYRLAAEAAEPPEVTVARAVLLLASADESHADIPEVAELRDALLDYQDGVPLKKVGAPPPRKIKPWLKPGTAERYQAILDHMMPDCWYETAAIRSVFGFSRTVAEMTLKRMVTFGLLDTEKDDRGYRRLYRRKN